MDMKIITLILGLVAAVGGILAAIRAEVRRASAAAREQERKRARVEQLDKVVGDVKKAKDAVAGNAGSTDRDKRDRLRDGTGPTTHK